jgi:hypothetical protein
MTDLADIPLQKGKELGASLYSLYIENGASQSAGQRAHTYTHI